VVEVGKKGMNCTREIKDEDLESKSKGDKAWGAERKRGMSPIFFETKSAEGGEKANMVQAPNRKDGGGPPKQLKESGARNAGSKRGGRGDRLHWKSAGLSGLRRKGWKEVGLKDPRKKGPII